MENRVDTVTSAIVDAVRGALKEQQVTFDEFRQGMKYLMDVADADELPLICDLFFNTTIVDIENQHREGTKADIEGPYFLEEVPVVTDGKIKVLEDRGGEPMVVRGLVKNTDGQPLEGVAVDVWASTPDGKYSGFHDNIDPEYYRGRIITGADGAYAAESVTPVPYQIPHSGPTGQLLEAMGRHSWRPAHIHYKVRKEGFDPLIMQAYFEGGDYVGEDCCQGNPAGEHVMPKIFEDGKRIVEIDFTL